MDTEQHRLILMDIVWALYDGKVRPSLWHCLRFFLCLLAGSSEYLIKLFSNNHAQLCWTRNTRRQAENGGQDTRQSDQDTPCCANNISRGQKNTKNESHPFFAAYPGSNFPNYAPSIIASFDERRWRSGCGWWCWWWR